MTMSREVFFNRVAAVHGRKPLGELSDDELVLALSIAQYATDVLVLEAEGRGMIDMLGGMPHVPFELPEGVERIPNVLAP